jgi:hypothetical protein
VIPERPGLGAGEPVTRCHPVALRHQILQGFMGIREGRVLVADEPFEIVPTADSGLTRGIAVSDEVWGHQTVEGLPVLSVQRVDERSDHGLVRLSFGHRRVLRRVSPLLSFRAERRDRINDGVDGDTNLLGGCEPAQREAHAPPGPVFIAAHRTKYVTGL